MIKVYETGFLLTFL